MVGMALDHGPTRARPPGEGVTPEADRLGPYRLVSRLGEGGMGVVHLALDPRGRAVAIKVLRAHVAHDADARQRLMREVETLSRIRDPRVASVIDGRLHSIVSIGDVVKLRIDTLQSERDQLVGYIQQ